MAEVLRVENLSFRYRGTQHAALRDISCTIADGEFVAVIGANGAGKSTFCNALVGLIPHYFVGAYRGEVTVLGKSVMNTSIADLSQSIGLVFQNPFNQLSYTAGTVAEELAYGLGNHGVDRESMLSQVYEVARIMRIEDLLEKNPLELSGGQIQRVAFGSAFIMRPRILVLDECTTQLDPLGAEEIYTIVRKLNDDGVTVIMVDHDMERVAQYADTVLVMAEGRLVASGTPHEVFCNMRLDEYGLEAPDYVDIIRALQTSGWTEKELSVLERDAIEAVKGAMAV